MLLDINCSSVCLDPLPRVMKTKTNKQRRPNHTYKLLTVKETINRTNRQPTEWEKILANDVTVKGLTSRVHKQFMQVSITEANNPGLNKHFSKGNMSPMAKKHMRRCLAPLIPALVLSCVRLSVTPWAVACGVLCPLSFSSNDTGEGCRFLFQEIMPTQGLDMVSALADAFLATAPPGKPIIREMQIRTTARDLLTLVRTASIEKSANSECWRTSCGPVV